MKHIICLLLVFASSGSHAQEVVASFSDNAYSASGKKIKKGQKLGLGENVKIKNGGELGLEYGRWSFSLKPGIYRIDSVLQAQKKTREFIVDDSIYTVLNSRQLLHCRSNQECLVFYETLGTTSKVKDNVILATQDSMVLKWDSRANYTGEYYVVFVSLFDEYLFLDTTTKPELEIDLRPFKRDKTLICKVISADCIQNDPIVIKMN